MEYIIGFAYGVCITSIIYFVMIIVVVLKNRGGNK